ncbi:Anp1-domain-containing protein [Rhodotorula diobovata]|uniref:Anp1-domain-containing protein n=1 Tax=Rhodotorula diobovata TaxID=5288 RepID=A0A5C5FS40_9BASI|nr:Anp1-domain-containing protein [Rhodotorula diobovata]
MFAPKRRGGPPPPPLPTSRLSPDADGLYKDKDWRPRSLRLRIKHTCTRPSTLAALFLAVFALAAWALGLVSSSSTRQRLGGGPRVIARTWSHPLDPVNIAPALAGPLIDDRTGLLLPSSSHPLQAVVILCPMRNAIEHIWHFFHLVDSLSYPRHLVHLAVLVSDSHDGTYARALELADERQYGPKFAGNRYARISVFEKDFAPADDDEHADGGSYAGHNVGAERHAYDAQVARRVRLAKSRSWLVSAALAPEVDWALWLDVDVVDLEPGLVQRLVRFAEGEDEDAREGADVVVPNCVWKTYNEMGAYDRNNWIETPESLALQETLSPLDVLIEGYPSHPTHRLNLASLVPTSPTSDLSPHSRFHISPHLPLSSLASFPPPGLTLPGPLGALAPSGPVPRVLDLDGTGGCAALVRAEVHREGAVFPAWPPVRNQVETEGFARVVQGLRGRGGARAGGDGGGGEAEAGGAEREGKGRGRRGRGRLLGLPGYYVYHGLYG